MPITVSSNHQALIEAHLVELRRRVERVAVRNLAYIGEMAVKYARELNTYQDQTGNLRSSIGYIVLHNGQVVKSSRLANFSVDGSDEGVEAQQALLSRLAKSHTRGLVLIVVAGMNYAAYVEAMGFDVLSGAQLTAERLARQLFKSS